MKRFTRVAAYGLILKEERILLCRLSRQQKDYGKWTLPGGGLEFGEHPEAGAVREIWEETGFEADIIGLVEVDSILAEFNDRMMHALRIIYWAEVIGGELCIELDGSTDGCEWFTQEEALSLPLIDLAKLGVEIAFDQAARLRSTSV